MNKELNKASKGLLKKIEDLCEGTKSYADEILEELYSLEEFYEEEEEDEN